MKAMVLAAGLGTRLGELTKETPKALVQAGGKAMLQHTIEKLKRYGVTALIINLHYQDGKIRRFVEEYRSFGIDITFSYEERILGTGGGIRKAQEFFQGEKCFFVHNCDVFSELDIGKLLEAHRQKTPIATLGLLERSEESYLLVNANEEVVGWRNKQGDKFALQEKDPQPRCFSGIQVISTEIFSYLDSFPEFFSIIEAYMKVVQAGRKVCGYHMGNTFWIDAGTPEKLRALDQYLNPPPPAGAT